MKRIISIVLCFMLVFTLCPSVFAAGENVCEIGERKFATLDDALNVVGDGETIRLLEHIDYSGGIAIVDKSIIFNLNGFNLNVLNATGGETIEENSGLYVEGNSTVSLEGEGEFNVTGTWYGVFAECNEGESAEVTVTNATGIGRDGVAAQSSKVTVKGDATSRGSTYSGVWASYENAEVIVEGDVYANGEMSMGVNTDTLASVTVKGSVIVDGDNSIGIKASDDGDVTVEGNVTVSGIDCIGVSFLSVADQPSIVTIKGVIEAEKYILFEAEDESKWEYSLRDGDFDEETADYIYYTKDNVSFVYVSMFAGGSGTAEDPYLIAHANQLYNIKYYHFFGKHYKQIADIDLGGYFSLGEGWDPIGLGESPFLGVYDGDGHTISNLFITRPYQGDIGLFGCVGELSEILNVGLLNADVTGRRDVGGLAAINAGIIANSYVTGKVSGTTYAGGLIGYNMGSVTDSYFDGTVSHVKGYDTDEVKYAGGLVGCNSEEGSITGCYAKATVESGGPLIGGLAGGNLGSITDSHAISAVTGYYYVGGLTGSNEGIVNNSYADGNVTGTSLVGGLIGYNSSLLADSYFTGTVTASDDYTGGLVGDNSGGSIEGCHADATVTSAEDYVGGLAGRSIGLITGSWSAGAVTGGSHVGGLVGASFINAGSGVISEGISDSYSACAAEGEMYVGGLAGYNEIPISESYATGDVTGTEEDGSNYTYAGGLVGHNTGPASDSYAWGDVSGQDMVGGLIGYNEADVTNCYEIGAVSGENYTGGLIGSNKPGAEITGSFWNNNTSGQDSSDGGESKGSVAMKQQVTYVNEDWNFETIWGIDLVQPYAFNDGYPFLRWQVKAEFAGGSGTMEDPYLIATVDHLNNVRNHLDKHFMQTADINLSGYMTGEGWDPIGGEYTPFTGAYDGNGHTISGLFIKRPVKTFVGLFANFGLGAKIKNVGLIDVDVAGYNHVGGLAGRNRGEIINSYAIGNVTGESETGGLIGENSGSLTDSYAKATVTDLYGGTIGGLAGENSADGRIVNCYAEATVTSSSTFYGSVGGLVGYNFGGITGSNAVGDVVGRYAVGGLVGRNGQGNIEKSYATATVTSTLVDVDFAYAGGLVGYNDTGSSISYSYATGAVSGKRDYIGGLVGYNKSSISTSYATGEVNGISSNIGGLVGRNEGSINNTYARGAVSGKDYIGGLVGNNRKSISASYATGVVNGVDSNIGGLVGYKTATSTNSNSYWCTETSLQTSSAGGEGRTTAEMKLQETYVGWDFAEIWALNAGENDGYPFLDQPTVATVPTEPQSFNAVPGDGQVALSWGAPAGDGGSAITKYQVSKDNGTSWTDVGLNTSHTFTDLTNGTAYTFKVRAVNSAGNGAETSTTATPTATPTPTYAVTVTNGTGGGEFAQGVTVTITANSAPDGQRFKEWQVRSGGITLINSQEASTSFQMPANAVEVAATYETIPETTYTVTVNGSYATATGAGSYAQDVTVTIDAGSRTNYSFNGWTSLDGVTFTNSNSATTTFIMPPRSVTVTANWTYRGGGGSGGGGSSTPTTPAAPSYKADVKAENGTETTLPVTVDKDTGTASVNIGSQGLDQGRTNITIPSIPDVDTYSVGIPVPDLSTSDVQRTLTVNTDAGSVTIPSNMLTGVSGISGSKAEIAIGQGDKDNLPDTVKAAIGDRPLVQISLSIDGKPTDWSNPDAPVTVSISYTPTAAELANPESIVVWYIDGSGNVVSVPNGRYDPTTGMVTFTTTHFSDYAVAYNKVSFNDVTTGAWHHKAISFIAARGITGGTGNGNYSPEVKLTRGQFIVMLMKAYGIAPDADPNNNFADAGATYYTGYLAAAKRLSISNGVGNNMFAPEKEITRQEMFTLLYNALKIIGQLPQDDSGKTLDHFSDAGQIDSWAKEAMRLMVKTGTIGGNAGKLNPTSTTTRAEMAQVLYNLLSK